MKSHVESSFVLWQRLGKHMRTANRLQHLQLLLKLSPALVIWHAFQPKYKMYKKARLLLAVAAFITLFAAAVAFAFCIHTSIHLFISTHSHTHTRAQHNCAAAKGKVVAYFLDILFLFLTTQKYSKCLAISTLLCAPKSCKIKRQLP